MISQITEFKTIAELFWKLSTYYNKSDNTIFAHKPSPSKAYCPIGWHQFYCDVLSLSYYLYQQGLQKGDRVGMISENRYEWYVIDMACQCLGVINVPLFPTLSHQQCKIILANAKVRMCFVSNTVQLHKITKHYDDLNPLKNIIIINQPTDTKDSKLPYLSLYNDIIKSNIKTIQEYEKEIKQIQVNSEDIATIIYTSGTTGNPKGVMLTHDNIVSNIIAAHQHLNIFMQEERCLSFLPLCHIFERMAGYYAMLAGGVSIYIAQSINTISSDILEAKPTIFIAVPRFYERIYSAISQKMNASPIKKKLMDWALKVGKKHAEGANTPTHRINYSIANKIVFQKIKDRTGGHIKYFISGGGPLPIHVGLFLQNIGFSILEGYGLTESSPVICVNQPQDVVIGTVGTPIPEVTVGVIDVDTNKMLATLDNTESNLNSEAGEIVCKGPNVMKGYWQNQKATNEVIDKDKWFHTGDIGRFENGKLRITDRLKSMIINEGGKNIYPAPIEELIASSPMINQIMLIGEQKPFIGALVVPEIDVISKHVTLTEKEKIFGGWIDKKEVIDIIKNEVDKFSNQLATYEKIRAFACISEPFSVENDQLTPTLKIRRHVVEKKYKDLIERIYDTELVKRRK